MRAVLLAGLLVGGCVTPAYEDCVLTCGVENTCPSGLVCDQAGWCRVGGAEAACSAAPGPTPDASSVDAQTCACDPFTEGCCGSDQVCDVSHAVPTPFCRAETADGKQASQCQNATQCALAHSCVDDPAPDFLGACHRFCDDHSDCEGTGGLCVIDVGAGYLACSTKCNPRDGAGCPSGNTCVLSYTAGETFASTDCRIGGAGVDGSACTGDWGCVKGHFCRSGQCARYCRTDSDDCPDSQSCVALHPPDIFVAGERWGYCD